MAFEPIYYSTKKYFSNTLDAFDLVTDQVKKTLRAELLRNAEKD
jgi:hypothetical protein|tara:strand:- start:5260 stop:5391 length:132 start_codon:yes stop_codon:yes gene_type:complete